MEDWAYLFKKRKKWELGAHIPNQKIPPSDSELGDNKCPEETDRLLSQRFSKLKHKALYLNMEYDEVFPIFQVARSTFISSMFQYCHEQELNAPFESVPLDSPPGSLASDSEESKELYREIVRKTHPDRLKGLDDSEIEERVSLYHEATTGRKTGDFHKILKVALELNISLKTLTSEYLDQMEAAIGAVEAKVMDIKKDIMWKWYYASPEDQQSIFAQLTQKQS